MYSYWMSSFVYWLRICFSPCVGRACRVLSCRACMRLDLEELLMKAFLLSFDMILVSWDAGLGVVGMRMVGGLDGCTIPSSYVDRLIRWSLLAASTLYYFYYGRR